MIDYWHILTGQQLSMTPVFPQSRSGLAIGRSLAGLPSEDTNQRFAADDHRLVADPIYANRGFGAKRSTANAPIVWILVSRKHARRVLANETFKPK